ncbi:energy coupling factor transporter S component ThiW [Ohessyouella blattaphilus]|uniref:Energy coupling factor transporter S component ThiW n=1 Tax=Ohessyouella blattaphilus TaxID=2949333 RepID=A0ABT1EN80_9FIRM|nr:energy coupling factor transporter S component ThiW [Ohessyouella blattaphilus]MCP1111237.1 energy coupling factor transporter S component ThiW [Ohessyouella blattaphilus]MCR8564631.1 energy coupling factor transporter S component ThiW [Ohessyouella blattaphilus]
MKTAVRNKVVLKTTILAFLVALGYVLSPILRIPGMAPMQHFINVLAAVLLGPWYSFACALLIALLRMTFMGINLLAVSGAIIGPIFAGLLYKKTGKLFAAVLGEIFGTGIIGALISGPIMKYIYGFPDIKWYTYLPSFLLGTIIGGSVAYLLLIAFKKRGVLSWMEQFCKE